MNFIIQPIFTRCVEEPVRTIAGVHYHQANATAIDFDKQIIKCKDFYTHYETNYKDLFFDLHYDKLAVAVGQKSNTFGLIASREEEGDSTSGTDRQNVFFLKRKFNAFLFFDSMPNYMIESVSAGTESRMIR